MSLEFDQILLEPAYRKVAAAIGGAHPQPHAARGRAAAAGDGAGASVWRQPIDRARGAARARERRAGGAPPGLEADVGQPAAAPCRRQGCRPRSRAARRHLLEVWEALTQLEPPMAEVAARNRTQIDLDCLAAACQRFTERQRGDREGRASRRGVFPLCRTGDTQSGARPRAGAAAAVCSSRRCAS